MQTGTVNVIQITEERLQELLSRAAQSAAHQALIMAGLPIREYFTRTEMQRRHGRRHINELLKQNKLTPHQLPTEGEETKRIVYSETEYQSLIK